MTPFNCSGDLYHEFMIRLREKFPCDGKHDPSIPHRKFSRRWHKKFNIRGWHEATDEQIKRAMKALDRVKKEGG